jgi:hypothetical protein
VIREEFENKRSSRSRPFIPSVGRNRLSFDERVIAPKRRAGMGRLRIGAPVSTSSAIVKLTEPYETGTLLPMQQIHPLLGSVMT